MKKSLGANTIVPTTPVWVVGTYDQNGKPNVMTAAWGGVCCSKPPCIYVSLRKATYTYGNIVERKSFTVNIPSEAYTKEADYFGMTSGKTVDKFLKTGLTPVKSDLVDAPYVKEFPLVLECKVIQIVEIGLHTEFIGEIMDVKADPSVLNEKNLPDIEKMNPIIWNIAEMTYHKVGKNIGQAFSIGKKIK
jgi:flavin reductase (DIM6/NTAB) family NADH-FMN oxidoreductase RutF